MSDSPATTGAWRWLVLLCIAMASITFLVAGVTKVWSPVEFAIGLRRYAMVPEGLTPAVALYLPWLEICVAVGIWVRSWRLVTAWVMLALMVAFTVVLVAAWVGGDTGDCGCMGAIATSIPVAVVRNGVVMGALCIVLRAVSSNRLPAG